MGLNPFSSVRGVKQDGREGKTPEISINQARQLFRSIDAGDVVGKRDRAVLGVLAYTGARINAVARLRLGDFQDHGEQRMLRFAEKGGKERQIPVRHDLEAWLRDYIESAGIADEPKSSALFRPAEGNRPLLLDRFYTVHSMRQMFTRRLKDAGLPELLSPHSFRVVLSSSVGAWQTWPMKRDTLSYHGYRFPPDIISHAVWLYHRFGVSFRDVEDLLAQRGITVSYEAIRLWCLTIGSVYARRLKRRQGRLGDIWHLDEVLVTIQGQRRYL